GDQLVAAAEQGESAPVGQVCGGVVEVVRYAEDLTVWSDVGVGARGFAIEDRVYAPEGVHARVQVGGRNVGFLGGTPVRDEGLRGQDLPGILDSGVVVG